MLRTIERALRPDPRERFESAISMARSLELVLRSLAEINDPLSLSHAIDAVLPRGKPAPPKPEAKPAAKTPSMEIKAVTAPPAKLGIKKEATDQLDLNELRRLRIDEE